MKHLILMAGLSFLWLIPTAGKAEDGEKQKVFMNVEYTKYMNANKILSANLREKKDGKFKPVFDLPVNVYIEINENDSLITTLNTDEKGMAYFVLENESVLPVNEEGITPFKLVFDGNDQYKGAKKSLEVQDLNIMATISNEKIIDIKASLANNSENSLPEELKVTVLLERMFTDMKIGETTLQNGSGIFEFTENIPSSKNDELVLKIVVEDDLYQKVLISLPVSWAENTAKVSANDSEPAHRSYIIFMVGSTLLVIGIGFLLNVLIKNKSKNVEV